LAIYDPLWWTPPPKPGPGYVWKNNKWVKKPTGKPVLPGDKPKPTPVPASPSGGGGGYGGGGGGGGTANPGLSTYIQEYRLRFRPGGDPPPDLLKKAKDNNWSIAYFDQQVRLNDKNYWRSIEAKSLLPSFNRTMKILFPGLADKTKQAALMKSKFYKQTAMWYLKNGIGMRKGGEEVLYGHITNTARWNKANPYWKDFAKNRNIGVVAESNPLLYKQYLDTLKEGFAQVGLDKLPEDYYRTFFRGRYASKEGIGQLAENLKQYSGTAASQGWFQGEGLSSGQTKTAVLDADAQGRDLRARMAKSFGVRSSFLGSEEKPLGNANLNERGKLVNPLV
jgi:hypothetical protein